MSSYEQYCDDYALFGDPERDAADYEENARYDRWDGHRDEGDDDPCMDCIGMESQGDCDDCCIRQGRCAGRSDYTLDDYLDDMSDFDDCDIPF